MKISEIRQFLKSFANKCSELDNKWITRKRKLNTLNILQLLMFLVWDSGQTGIKTAIMKLITLSEDHTKFSVSASAFSQARQRIHWNIIRSLFEFSLKYYLSNTMEALWRKRRIFAIDGTKLNLPATIKDKKYIYPSKNAHYPQGLLTTLYQLKANIPHGAQLCRHFDERRAAKHHLNSLKEGDVIVVDRGFFLQNL